MTHFVGDAISKKKVVNNSCSASSATPTPINIILYRIDKDQGGLHNMCEPCSENEVLVGGPTLLY